jgi:hypothetical protein
MSPDRIIHIPALRDGASDAVLMVYSDDDGESARIELIHEDRIIAAADHFSAPGSWTYLNGPEAKVAGTFGAFVAAALDSGVRDGWEVLDDDAWDWVDAFALMECDA